MAYLIPGNRPAPTFDPTKTNTLEVSSAGGFGRGGNITVDGGDNNDEVVGGTLANFPEDSIAEFQIATGRFTAEVGRSGNSIINIVTKSGTNDFHGSAFLFERNRNLQALPATFDRGLPTPPFDREQYGGSIGGPIEKRKAWWFSSLEYRDQNADIQTGTRDFTTDTIENTAAPAPLRDLLLADRGDYQLNSANTLIGALLLQSFDRHIASQRLRVHSPQHCGRTAEFPQSLQFRSLRRGPTCSAPAGPMSFLSTTTISTTTFRHSANDASLTDPPLGLTNELIFPDLADGANFNLPQTTHLDRFRSATASPWTLGKHALKVGGEFQHYTAHGEINVFGTGTVILTSDFGFADLNGDGVVNDLDIPVAVAIHSTAPVVPVPIPHVGNSYTAFYAQDDWRVHPNLTLNLGLRWEYDSDLTGTSSDHDPCPNLTTVPTQPCVWMANVIDLKKHPDTKDFGPRVGFVYDPFGHGKDSRSRRLRHLLRPHHS